MKTKQYFFIIILIIIVLVLKSGIYQRSIITVDDIELHKRLGYKFTYIPSDENLSFLDANKNLLSLNNSFKLDGNSSIYFKFENIFLNQNIVLSFSKNRVELNLLLENIKNNNLKTAEEEKCTYEYEFIKNKYFQIYGVQKNKDIIFMLRGNPKKDIMKLKDDICK